MPMLRLNGQPHGCPLAFCLPRSATAARGWLALVAAALIWAAAPRLLADDPTAPAAPVPAKEAPAAPEVAPVKVPFEMPLDGVAAIELHDAASGKLVRRLVGESLRPKGTVQEPWDLKDLTGQPVLPGKYVMTGLARPPFKLTYELTLYNAGIPGWWAPAPAKGGGGWMADHTMSSDVVATADRMWISAPCAESGHSMMATDLEGIKQWGTGMMSFGFDGPRKIAADARCGYAATVNFLFRVDATHEFKSRPLFTFPNDADVPWITSNDVRESGGGLAVRDDKLYFAVSTPSSWLRSSFVSDSVDPARCQPLVFLFKGKGHRTRNDKNYDFYEYDELMLLYATFGCARTPQETPTMPNHALTSTILGGLGDAPTSGAYKGSVVLTFKEPVLVSSILVPDGAIQVAAMRPGRKMPATGAEASASASGVDDVKKDKEKSKDTDDMLGDIKDDAGLSDEWQPLPLGGPAGRPAVVTAPPGGLKTTALRFKVKRLAYSLVMSHRLADVSAQGKLLFSEGAATASGGWSVTRSNPAISEMRPATVAITWPAAQALRGISLVHPPSGSDKAHSRCAIDRWIGDTSPSSAAALADDAQWELVKTIDEVTTDVAMQQVDFNGTVTTRALRLRFLSVLPKEGVFTAGFDGLVAYHPLGDDPQDLPPDLSQRISVFKLPPVDDDKAPAVFERHLPLAKPGNLVFDAAGTLYAVSDGQVVTVPLKAGEASRVVIPRTQVAQPLGLAIGPDGNFYVTDLGPKVIKVFSPTGTLVRTIGHPGGLQPGAWDPLRLACPSGIAVDATGHVWVTDYTYQPKRVIRYTPTGEVDSEFLGPTQYGGGGTMDCRDRRYVYYQGMKFTINWDDHTWKFNGLLGQSVDRAVYWKDHRYLTGPTPQGGELASIAVEQPDVTVKLMAQAGRMADWPAVKQVPELRAKFGGLDLGATFFVWSDRNGDAQPQADEVQVKAMYVPNQWVVGEDLTFLCPGLRLRPSSILPSGVPEYDLAKLETFKTFTHGDGARGQSVWGDDQGRTFIIGTRLIGADGQSQLWEYFNQYAKHDGFYAAGWGYRRPPGVLNQEHYPIGHIKLNNGQGQPEEYYITNSDAGDWFCYTADGLLVGCLLGGPDGFGKKNWSMPEWEPGKTDLSDLRAGQEHYQGCVVHTDGHVYMIAGHNHMSVVRVDGLEQLQRLHGEVTITPEDLEQTRLWSMREATRMQAATGPKLTKLAKVRGPPDVSGALEAWPAEMFITIAETTVKSLTRAITMVDGAAALAFDDQNLYVAMRVRNPTPPRNAAVDPLALFKGGDAAEVTLGLDPQADPKRLSPVAGDLRLLFAKLKGKPVVVLYKPVDPTATPEQHREFSSPVGRVRLDRVEVLATAKLAFQGKTLPKDDGGYFWTMEAAVPWAALGVKPPEPGTTIRGDIGYLSADENGTQTVNRTYWSGKSQTVICDLPSEARLNPSLWGQFEVIKADAKVKLGVTNGIDPGQIKKRGDDDPTLLLDP